jgi:CheY-like chemotaxis protein
MNKIRLLIADDHTVLREGLVTILNAEPDLQVVAEASNGKQAVELYQKHQPDVTLMDLCMPLMDGVAAIQAIHAFDHDAGILVLTTYDGDEALWGSGFLPTAHQGVEFRSKGSKLMGRDHHPRAFTMWMAGAGVKKGITLGATDEFGYNITADPVEVHDLHATMLHLLGLDHTKLTYRFQGRDFRLTDVHGVVMDKLLA